MRKIIMSLLLASVAASPAMAFDRSDREAAREEREQRAKEERAERAAAREERQQPREERQQARESRQPAQVDAPVRAERVERVRQRANDAPAAAVQAPVERQRADRRGNDRQQFERQQFERQAIERQQIDRQRFDQRADRNPGQRVEDVRQRADARRQQWDQQRAERIARQEAIRNQRPPVISPTPRPGTQPPPPPVSARPVTNPPVQWSTNHWRKDRRYDWYKHRNKYWWLFQLGWYSDPFGWGYQPYGIGWRMWPSYYSSRYWLNDPWQYRLPYAPPGTRWIRYWDDAVLVDLWSGQVVDVVYNFFW